MEELPHIRCIECNKPIAHKWNKYNKLLSQGVKPKDALDQLGLVRYCCRLRMMNPFKVPGRVERQIDPIDIASEQMKTLTVSTQTQVENLAPLQMMKRTTPSYTITPQTEITLPDVLGVTLPDIPSIGGEIVPEQPGNIIRTYQAW